MHNINFKLKLKKKDQKLHLVYVKLYYLNAFSHLILFSVIPRLFLYIPLKRYQIHTKCSSLLPWSANKCDFFFLFFSSSFSIMVAVKKNRLRIPIFLLSQGRTCIALLILWLAGHEPHSPGLTRHFSILP